MHRAFFTRFLNLLAVVPLERRDDYTRRTRSMYVFHTMQVSTSRAKWRL